MTLNRTRSWIPSESQWDDAWHHCPYSTYFHGREWAKIWGSYSEGHFRPAPLAFKLPDDTQVLLPFSQIGTGSSRSFMSSPTGTFGGWIADRALNEPEQKLVVKFIRGHFPDLLWRFNPYEKVLPEIKFGKLKSDVTHALDLSAGFDAIVKQWTKGHASAARKAKKSGVTVRLATSLEDWREYYAIYQDSLLRWAEKASSKYDWRLFDCLHDLQSSNIKLWLAEHEGKAIAGALCFYSPQHAVYWHGAALADNFSLRPVNFLIHEVIRDATESGRRWFDFNPSGSHEGVTAFKKSFGTQALAADILITRSNVSKIIDLVRKTIRRVRKP